jgi:hypothetical protein
MSIDLELRGVDSQSPRTTNSRISVALLVIHDICDILTISNYKAFINNFVKLDPRLLGFELFEVLYREEGVFSIIRQGALNAGYNILQRKDVGCKCIKGFLVEYTRI